MLRNKLKNKPQTLLKIKEENIKRTIHIFIKREWNKATQLLSQYSKTNPINILHQIPLPRAQPKRNQKHNLFGLGPHPPKSNKSQIRV